MLPAINKSKQRRSSLRRVLLGQSTRQTEGTPPLLADVHEPTRLPPHRGIWSDLVVQVNLMSMESEFLQNRFEIAFEKLSKDEVMQVMVHGCEAVLQ